MLISVNDEMIEAGIASDEMMHGADIADEEHHDDRREQRAEDQVLFERGNRRVDEARVVADDRDLDLRRQRALDRASVARTPSMTATVFSPIARRMSSMTAGVLPSQTALVGRWKLSSAWPTSEIRIGVPFLVATTMSLKSSGGIDAAERAEQQLTLALLDRAAGDFHVLRDDGVAQLGHRQPVRIELLDVDDDVDLAGAAAR